ncbi:MULTISPECIES: phosphoadenosine phosphosulfate reductase family protein [unclassified Pseudomonas]|uniref:phosphoadenosine phosphosulfate reductase domain-containing protein n=1 Tax=unclassified Pseudomonas TaxID=196821 RepID=UPI000C882037|nr:MULTISPECIES: phosphoadenosine phosphosulfate reductase family protein [unclassified Pseudomonas]PMX16877.1 phosphoadenosine phosphosulfate reductase [Pseudomonas sp. MPBC4-3]PMX48198.1 phosphoadenosine phosphosulfate reductase [Pseudomonas sp. FW301-21B01]PMY08815.1 phosphoadenosine phosphosulfate reductase [Pseudomonas sp. MPR-R5A]PMY11523.1 phosphoadenosine phosphosulfate reductase [Pseudomonas sp. MPR-R2A5]PNA66638.1 phosphoadenosine phosphosulfate reductase [Pseudomonas sp. MPR-R5B]
MSTRNIVSVSGGKDSTATLLVAMALEAPNLQAVFADTGNEHEQTYEYLDYLEQATRTKITRVRADFTKRIEGKRRFIESKWRAQGIAEEVVLAALDVLQPTGNPFLDLCIWKGRFPSRKAQFCTMELKRDPMLEQVVMPLMGAGDMILSWQGVRADESLNRRYLPECDEVGGGLFNYRPILKWDVPAVFEAHRYMGIKPNPLYSQGMGRVGCMPCINCRKDELREIALRFPDAIDRIDRWERTVQQASKRGAATFFAGSNAKHPKGSISGMTAIEVMEIASIRQAVEWSKTARGGIQYDLMIATDASACSSAYGLCESAWEPVTMEAA